MPASSASLRAHDLTVRFADVLILDRVSLAIGPTSRVGIVAPNGTGKTTLLRALAGAVPLDGGAVTLAPPTATVGYLPQEAQRSDEEDVLSLLARRTGVGPAATEMEAAAAAMSAPLSTASSTSGASTASSTSGASAAPSGRAGSEAEDRYGAALEQWLALGGADFESRCASTVSVLGLDDRLLSRATAALSGGQAARVSLAAILLSRYDVLLLDEPTNDLDFDGLERLESFVQGRRGGMIVVSHDREFLRRVVTSVVEIDEFSHRAERYDGGWDAYLDARDTARALAREAYETYVDKRDRLAGRGQQQREWAMQGASRGKKRPRDGDKHVRAMNLAQTEKLAGKARATERAMERLEVVESPRDPWELRLTIASAPRSGVIVARLEAATVRRGDFVLGPINLEIASSERIAVIGRNGSGKSTLIDALLGRLPLESGRRWMGPGVVVGEMDQARRQFSDETGSRSLSLLSSFCSSSGLSVEEARTLLAKFGLGAGDVHRTATSLSPGERTRASLALLMARGVNCLVLDEPTNHLDLAAIEQLEAALEHFDGTLLLVTHDRRLREAVRIDREIAL